MTAVSLKDVVDFSGSESESESSESVVYAPEASFVSEDYVDIAEGASPWFVLVSDDPGIPAAISAAADFFVVADRPRIVIVGRIAIDPRDFFAGVSGGVIESRGSQAFFDGGVFEGEMARLAEALAMDCKDVPRACAIFGRTPQ